MEIEPSPYWSQIDPSVIVGDADAQKDYKVHVELIPLREALHIWAAQFSLVDQDVPVFWAMDSAVETLRQAGRRPPEKRVLAWGHPIEMSEAYPALTEPGEWVRVGTGMPEEELFRMLVIEIHPENNQTKRARRSRSDSTRRVGRHVNNIFANFRKPIGLRFNGRRGLVWIGSPRTVAGGYPTIRNRPHDEDGQPAVGLLARNDARTADYLQITPRKSKTQPTSRKVQASAASRLKKYFHWQCLSPGADCVQMILKRAIEARCKLVRKALNMRMDHCKSSLSAPRQKLLQSMQRLHFGTIENLIVRGGEPSFVPPPKVTKEIKLGIETTARPASQDGDFLLKRNVSDLFGHFDRLRDGSVVSVEVRHSLPTRLIIITEA